jgi:hypothetical protein
LAKLNPAVGQTTAERSPRNGPIIANLAVKLRLRVAARQPARVRRKRLGLWLEPKIAPAFERATSIRLSVSSRSTCWCDSGRPVGPVAAATRALDRRRWQAVRHLMGVVTVQNAITLKPQTSVAQVKEKVRAALQRQAKVDTESIHIETSGGKVTLTGHASSWQSIEDAANAAWAAPGVTQVVDQIKHSMTI